MSKLTARQAAKDSESNRKNSKQRQKTSIQEIESTLDKTEIERFLSYKGLDDSFSIDAQAQPFVSIPKALSQENLVKEKSNNSRIRSNRRVWSELSDKERRSIQRSSPLRSKIVSPSSNVGRTDPVLLPQETIPKQETQDQEDEVYLPINDANPTNATQGLYFDFPSDLQGGDGNELSPGFTESFFTENGQTTKVVSAEDGSSVQMIFMGDAPKNSLPAPENKLKTQPFAQLVIESITDERAPDVHYPISSQNPKLDLEPTAKRIEKGYGAKFTSKPVLQRFSYLKDKSTYRFNTIPNAFDWRTKTSSDGKPFLSPVKDQGGCGSCYALATVTAFEARIRIATDGTISEILSPQDMVNCGPSFVSGLLNNPSRQSYLNGLYQSGALAQASWYALEGCNGGLLASAADYIVLEGVPKESDVPYTASDGTCRDGLKRFKGYKAYDLVDGIENGFPTYQVTLDPTVQQQNVMNMQMAIMNDGPIVTGLNIYTDFLYYPQITQVYYTQSSFTVGGRTIQTKYEGGHAVAVVGWGETVDGNGQPLPYWICQNQWGTGFGFDGFFYIKRGVNMANIELYAIAIFPDTPSFFATSGQGQEASFSLANGVLKNGDMIAGIPYYWWIVIAFAIAVVVVVVITVSVIYSKKNREAAALKKQTASPSSEQASPTDIYDIQ